MEDDIRLGHERLDVYRFSIELVAEAYHIARALPRGHGVISDQFRRAALSVPLNIAEASGRTTANDAARHFSIARGSALECGAVLDVLVAIGLMVLARGLEVKRRVARIVRMLTKLARV